MILHLPVIVAGNKIYKASLICLFVSVYTSDLLSLLEEKLRRFV